MKRKIQCLFTLAILAIAVIAKACMNVEFKEYVIIVGIIYAMTMYMTSKIIDNEDEKPKKRIRHGLSRMANYDLSEDLTDVHENEDMGFIAKYYDNARREFIKILSKVKQSIEWFVDASDTFQKMTKSRYKNINDLMMSLNDIKLSINNINVNFQQEVAVVEEINNHISEIKCSDTYCKESISELMSKLQNLASNLEEITSCVDNLSDTVSQEQDEYLKLVDMVNVLTKESISIKNNVGKFKLGKEKENIE